jgi:hypothetical protein
MDKYSLEIHAKIYNDNTGDLIVTVSPDEIGNINITQDKNEIFLPKNLLSLFKEALDVSQEKSKLS